MQSDLDVFERQVRADDSQGAHFPSAKGVSGGAVWRGDGDPRQCLKTAPFRLVGIGIEDRENDALMIAVVIYLVLESGIAVMKRLRQVEFMGAGL